MPSAFGAGCSVYSSAPGFLSTQILKSLGFTKQEKNVYGTIYSPRRLVKEANLQVELG